MNLLAARLEAKAEWKFWTCPSRTKTKFFFSNYRFAHDDLQIMIILSKKPQCCSSCSFFSQYFALRTTEGLHVIVCDVLYINRKADMYIME